MKVLIVEDNADHRDLMTTLLSVEGYSVIAAEDGCEGIIMAEAHHPALIITDLCMPRLDGIGLLRKLRARPDFESVPIIVLSACDWIEQAKALRAGATLVESKPVEFAKLIRYIKTMLRQHAS